MRSRSRLIAASRVAERLGNAGYEILNQVDLNEVLVAFGGDDYIRRYAQVHCCGVAVVVMPSPSSSSA